MARIIQRDKDGRPFFVPPPPPKTNPEDEERNMEIKTGKKIKFTSFFLINKYFFNKLRAYFLAQS